MIYVLAFQNVPSYITKCIRAEHKNRCKLSTGGVLMRLGFSSAVEYQGVGLGSGKTVRRHRLHVLHSWSILLQKVDSSASVHRSSFASSPSSSARPGGREGADDRNSGKWVWSLYADQVCDRVVGASGCDVLHEVLKVFARGVDEKRVVSVENRMSGAFS